MAHDDTNQVQLELEALGYSPVLREWARVVVVEFDYTVEDGSQAGETFKLGVSFQKNGYPNYPPHWIHVSPPIDDGRGGIQCYTTGDGREWVALSRPPRDIWDGLSEKNMKNYLDIHIRRFWSHL